MGPTFDWQTVRFAQPQYLWLLVAPLAFLVLWVRQIASRRSDAHQLMRHRTLPLRERFRPLQGLLFWLCLIVALGATIVALAQPRARLSAVRTAGVDIIVLQDGSASMHVRDVSGNRWQRSIRFLRVLGNSLAWDGDRIAMALFAHIASPQIRLTRDPNTFFFFIDHLAVQSPFPLEDDTTWDTNIEQGLYWGLRLMDKDQEIHGPSPNGKAFVLVSDGEAWSGDVEESIKVARAHGVPVFVVGVGTTAGGLIPQPAESHALLPEAMRPPLYASIDRESLKRIAAEAGGQYFELDRQRDREIANQIVDDARRRAGAREPEERAMELYWQVLLVAACAAGAAVVFSRDRGELWIQLGGTAVILVVLLQLLR